MRVEDEPIQHTIRKCINKLVDFVYGDDTAIKEGVEKAMGGTVIYNEIDQAFDEGVEKGIEQGLEQGLRALVNSLKVYEVRRCFDSI